MLAWHVLDRVAACQPKASWCPLCCSRRSCKAAFLCAGHHQAARPAALRTMPLPELDSLAARPAGAGLSDALLDSSAGLDASRPAVDEVLATQQDDELSGSDAEGTPRCACSGFRV